MFLKTRHRTWIRVETDVELDPTNSLKQKSTIGLLCTVTGIASNRSGVNSHPEINAVQSVAMKEIVAISTSKTSSLK
uniref:Uncharacterized protein n=1 Tax=Rhodnius prolixus TaxID=13249 RepID=T1IGP4_RHOPR